MTAKVKVGPVMGAGGASSADVPGAIQDAYGNTGGKSRSAGIPDDTTSDPNCSDVAGDSESTSSTTQSVRDHLSSTDPDGHILSDPTNPLSNRWEGTLGAGGGGGFLSGTTQVETLSKGTWLVRYYGGDASRIGSWWFGSPVSGDPRALGALPPGSTASKMVKAQIKEDVDVLSGAGAPRCAGKPGGPKQFCLPYPASDHVVAVPGCLMTIRDKAEFERKLAEAPPLIQELLDQGKTGVDEKQAKTLLKKTGVLAANTKAGSEPATWQERQKEAASLVNIFQNGWDPKDYLGKMLYGIGNFYAHRSPIVIVANQEEFKDAVDEALNLSQKAIRDRKAGKPGAGSVTQLQSILRYMKKLEKQIQAGKHPTPRERQANVIGPMILDGWDPGDFLGKLVYALDSWYARTKDF